MNSGRSGMKGKVLILGLLYVLAAAGILGAEEVSVDRGGIAPGETIAIWADPNRTIQVGEIPPRFETLELIRCDLARHMCQISKTTSDGLTIRGWVERKYLKSEALSAMKTYREYRKELEEAFARNECAKVLEIGENIVQYHLERIDMEFLNRVARCAMRQGDFQSAYYVLGKSYLMLGTYYRLNWDQQREILSRLYDLYETHRYEWKTQQGIRKMTEMICRRIDRNSEDYREFYRRCDSYKTDEEKIERKYRRCLKYRKRHPGKNCEQYRDPAVLSMKADRCRQRYGEILETLSEYRKKFACRP
jgi:tetratricopeptide (TPR) repeat protein